MAAQPHPDLLLSSESTRRQIPFAGLIVPGVEIVRGGRREPFLETVPAVSSASVRWRGIALASYEVPSTLIHRHEHPEDFLHVVLRGSARCEVTTRGRHLSVSAHPGTIFLLPRGTIDEVNWTGPTQRIAIAIHPSLLSNAIQEATHGNELELKEQWNLIDRHISALVMEMTADLEDSSPAGMMYGESLANALAVYLLKRYSVRPIATATYKGGLPPYRLRRVLEYIAESLDEDVSLLQLAAIADMSPHYFSELFKQSTGCTPHNYVLLQKIERAKQHLREGKHSITDAALDAGFQNTSHFARVFRKAVGVTPSRFRAQGASTKLATRLQVSSAS